MLRALHLVMILCVFFKAWSAETTLPHPGKLFMWSYSNQNRNGDYVTKSMDVPQALQAVHDLSKEHEIVVILNQANNVEDALVRDHVTKTGNLKVFNYIYPNKEHSTLASALKNTLNGQTIKDESEMKAILQDKDIMNNKKAEVFHVSTENVHSVFQRAISKEIPDELKSKILFVSYVDIPKQEVVMPSRVLLGEYSNLMGEIAPVDTTISSDLNDGVLYSPEGSEYAIYYADKYLYITPDIFTGIMTGLFVFFTLLIGITCLGEIQGMSSFYDKLPIVGREA